MGEVSKQKGECLGRVLSWRYLQRTKAAHIIHRVYKRGTGVILGRIFVIVRIKKPASREGR